MTEEEFYQALTERHGIERQKKISKGIVGIAGLGGLGSNVAYLIARLGVGKLVLADFDRVEISNLNRQQYGAEDVGRYKAEALVQGLRRINPYGNYVSHRTRVTPENIKELFGECHVIVEAFDRPEEKAMLLEQVLTGFERVPLVTASGMAGCGSANTIRTRKLMGRVYLCGDETSDMEQGLMAPRVAICAAQEANMVLRLLLGEKEP